MKLDRFCFVLPPESTDRGPSFDFDKPIQRRHEKKDQADNKTQARHGCGNQVLLLIHGLVSRMIEKIRHHRTAAFVDTDGVYLFDKVGKENPRVFGFAELYIGTRGFSEDELLGSGGFGKVYRAVLPGDGTVAAVKIVAEKGDRFEKTFEAELAAVAHLRHRNLVRLLGWCTHEDQLLLVYDYMPNRSLDRVLFRNTNEKASAAASPPPLSWEMRRKIIGGLAAGLHYLHENLETQIIHRDVKTSNVMLDSDFSARLGDFGLARWVQHELEYVSVAQTAVVPLTSDDGKFRLADTTRIGGTIGYLPPESFQGSRVTAKSDVFSFGVVALEVASGRRAVDLAYPDEKIVLLDWVRRLSDEGKVVQVADKRLPLGYFDRTNMEQLVHLGLLCTVQNPTTRPNMKWVVEVVSGNIIGKLPGLPSFRSQPLYIAFSSDSNLSTSNLSTTTSSTTALTRSDVVGPASVSSKYFTANGDTFFATAAGSDEEKPTTTAINTTNSAPQRFVTVETPREIPYNALLTATANFSESRKVAELDFGTAYRGRLNNRDVLVKKLGMSKCPALRGRFSDELRNLGRLRHRNLVQLRGWCTELGEMIVVYDDDSPTHLLSHHANPKSNQTLLTWRHRYSIVKALAGAILYLHEEWDEQVIHRNITSSTVILDSDLNPRLSGFALAEFLTRNDHGHKAASRSGKSVRGIFGYVSPEYIESGEATTAADIYSFGVVVLEVVTGESAVDFRRKEVLLVRRVVELERELVDLVDSRLNGEYDYGKMVRLVKLGIACTRSDANLRPTIREIVSILDGNDRLFKEISSERIEEWSRRNSTSLSMIRSMRALGIH